MEYNNNIIKQKYEVLFGKQYHPNLNVQDNSVLLELFN